MRQPDQETTSALSFQPKRKTMLNCRDNCQAEMLLGNEPESDFEPVKQQVDHHGPDNEATREHWHVLRPE